MSLSIAYLPVADLRPHPRNPRRGDVSVITESLKANGQFKPIVVARGGTVIAGNHTLAAAESLGWTEIAAVQFDIDPDSDEAVRIMLADNRASDLGEYDDTDLLHLLEALGDDFDGTGYLLDDLEDLRHLTEVRDFAETVINTDSAGYSGAALAADGVMPDKGFAGQEKGYADKAVRSIVLPYDLAEYEEAVTLLGKAREATGTDTNAAAVLAVLRDAL